MSNWVYLGGSFVPAEQAAVSVFDHGLLYGDGVFEGIRCYGGKVFRMQEHVDRLFHSASSILLRVPVSKAELAALIDETIKRNELTDCYVRVVVTRGVGTLGLDIQFCKEPQLIIIAAQIQLYSKEFYEQGLKIITAATIRNHPAALSPRIKSLNYLNNIMGKIEAQNAGCVEAVMLNHKGEVSECTADNIFIVRQGEIWTPPLDAGILEGITRNAVMQMARAAGYLVQERTMTRHDLFTADEMFLTGTAVELVPVVELDRRPIGSGKPGPIFHLLRERFQELVRQ